MEPIFFASPAAWRAWLEEHHATETEVWVGLYKKHLNPSLTWATAVPEALCFGWIDGIGKRIDDDTFKQRFTPRKPTSLWSALNVRLVDELEAAGKMRPAGRMAFEARDTTIEPYAVKDWPDQLPEEWQARMDAEPLAAAYWASCPPGYRRMVVHRITDAKRPETREKRFALLVEACRDGRRLT